jgi:hypothetical protein
MSIRNTFSNRARLAVNLTLDYRMINAGTDGDPSEDIQSWLAGSTIKNMVYHGTRKKFDQFSYQKSKRFVLFSEFDVESKGFFFAESPHDAVEFGPNVAACYVRMTNPLLDPRRDKHLGIDRLPYEKEWHLRKILGPMIGREGRELFMDLGVRRVYLRKRTYEFPNQWVYEAIGPDGLDWDCLDNPGVVQKMVALGYDGTFVSEPESHIGRSIFVPSSDQIKIDTWSSGVQRSWGKKDDYFTKKQEGLNQFHAPDDESRRLHELEEAYEDDWEDD